MRFFNFVKQLIIRRKTSHTPESESDIEISKSSTDSESLASTEGEVVNPYAFIRVHNEIHTIKASLSSIEGILTRGVIGYHDCTDGTEEYILSFCQRNPGFIPFKYDKPVWSSKDPRYSENPMPLPYGGLDGYYNEVFEYIPNYEWFIKIDCDQVYDRELLSDILRRPQSKSDVVFLPRINLHYVNNQLFLLKQSPVSAVQDHWLVYKTPDLSFVLDGGRDDLLGQLCCWELLRFPDTCRFIDAEVTHWHFPFMKAHRSIRSDSEDLVPFDEAGELLKPYAHILPAKMIDKEYILSSIDKLGLKPWVEQ